MTRGKAAKFRQWERLIYWWLMIIPIGGSKGAPGTPQGPISFIFMQFSGNNWPNNRLAPPPGGGWIGAPLWEILCPPLIVLMCVTQVPMSHLSQSANFQRCQIWVLFTGTNCLFEMKERWQFLTSCFLSLQKSNVAKRESSFLPYNQQQECGEHVDDASGNLQRW